MSEPLPLLTLPQAARRLGVTVPVLRRELAGEDPLPTIRIGRRDLVSPDDLLAWRDGRRRPQAPTKVKEDHNAG
jgi:hypothetical protein